MFGYRRLHRRRAVEPRGVVAGGERIIERLVPLQISLEIVVGEKSRPEPADRQHHRCRHSVVRQRLAVGAGHTQCRPFRARMLDRKSASFQGKFAGTRISCSQGSPRFQPRWTRYFPLEPSTSGTLLMRLRCRRRHSRWHGPCIRTASSGSGRARPPRSRSFPRRAGRRVRSTAMHRTDVRGTCRAGGSRRPASRAT